MVKLPSIRGKKDEEAKEFQEKVVLTEQERQGMPLTEDYMASLGRSVYMILDPEVTKLLEENDLKCLIPVLSHLNRVTQIGKIGAELDLLDLEFIFLRLKCIMDEGAYEEKRGTLIESLQYFANHIPSDSVEGFKAKMLAYQMKIIETRLEEKKKKGLI